MLNDYYKYEPSMCNDTTNILFGECSSAKRSKTSKELSEPLMIITKNVASCWSHLPDIILHEIFDNLNFTDRTNASSVCKHWRRNLYHSKWWKNVNFNIQPDNIEKSRYYIAAFGNIVTHATIKLNTLSPECVENFISLMQFLEENSNLKSLIIEPTHCRFEIPPIKIEEKCCSEENDNLKIIKSICESLPQLNEFSIGCIEDLSNEIQTFLEILNGRHVENVTKLGLASVKDDPGKFKSNALKPSLIKPFSGLKILSIDYDELCDEFLDNLEMASNLERLIVHLHGVRSDHPATSNRVWSNFKLAHPNCELRLTVIHAFKDINTLHLNVLRKQMPLSHLKVFFCESVNTNVLECLSEFYRDTFKSLIWVDSLSQNEKSWAIAMPFYETPDPFLLISWLCKNLEEVILYGYKYWEENLIAVARLRGERLRRLEVAEEDILFYNSELSPHENCYKDIPLNLKRPWAPVRKSELHPVICNPTAGDSDEYLLPIVLADLH